MNMLMAENAPEIDDATFDLATMSGEDFIDLRFKCLLSISMSYMVELKVYLQEKYMLEDSVCIMYMPGATKDARNVKGLSIAKGIKAITLPCFQDFQDSNPIRQCWSQFVYCTSSFEKDSKPIDVSLLTEKHGKRRSSFRRRKSMLEKRVDKKARLDNSISAA